MTFGVGYLERASQSADPAQATLIHEIPLAMRDGEPVHDTQPRRETISRPVAARDLRQMSSSDHDGCDAFHQRARIATMGKKTEGQLNVIRKVVAALQAADISAWLFGGWGLDARIGRITREHGDVEFWVERVHAERSKALLLEAGATALASQPPEEACEYAWDDVPLVPLTRIRSPVVGPDTPIRVAGMGGDQGHLSGFKGGRSAVNSGHHARRAALADAATAVTL